MTLENKCEEYRFMFNRLEQEQPELYNRIRLFTNSCIGLDQINYKSIPRTDLHYLNIELSNLVRLNPEYSTVAQGLYERMENIVYNNHI